MKYLYQYKVKEHLEPNNENAIKYDVFTPSIRGGGTSFRRITKDKNNTIPIYVSDIDIRKSKNILCSE